MLTVDLVRARKKGDLLVASYLAGPAAERLVPIVRYYADTFVTFFARGGATRDEIDDALDAVEVPAKDRVAALGLRKVVEDRAEFAVTAGVDPEALRAEVFAASAAAHRALDVRARFDRATVLAEVAQKLGTTPESLDAGLYADLKGAEVLQRFDPIDPEEAIARYNLGLCQAVLLRAARVTVRLPKVPGESPARYRRIFRAARFHQLLHVVREEEDGYVIELDGPFSLFDAVSRYGLKLALFLPSVLRSPPFFVRADILWGKERVPLAFEVTPKDGIVVPGDEGDAIAPEIEVFLAAFQRLASEWSVAPSERIFALPGEVVCVPDLVFTSRETGEEVYLEVFGFWSRAAVWQRVELLRKGFPTRMILAAGKQLRVSEEVLGEDDAGEVYVYKQTMSPRAVLERLRAGKPKPAG